MNTGHMPVNKDLSMGIRYNSFPPMRNRWGVPMPILGNRMSSFGDFENNSLSSGMAGCTSNGIVFMNRALGIGMQECHCSGLGEATHGWLCLLKYLHWCRAYICFHSRNKYEMHGNEWYSAIRSQTGQYVGISSG